MIYWCYKTATAYEKRQIDRFIEDGTFKEDDYTLLEDKEWNEIILNANNNGLPIVNDSITNRPVIGMISKPTEEEKAMSEIAMLKNYLDSTDYCVIKCMEEGLQLSKVYPAEHSNRAEARKRINFLEAKIGAEKK